MRKHHNSFYFDNSPNKGSQYIFDDVYKNAAEKMKFENDPKFSYFNAIIQMKNKLSKGKSDVYEKVFNSDIEFVDSKSKPNIEGFSFHQQSKIFPNSTSSGFFDQSKKLNVDDSFRTNNKFSVTKVNFKFDHQRNKSQFYSEKPRLDDIMAQYRKINKTARMNQTKSVSYSRKKNQNPLDMLRTNGNFLPKCQPKKRKRNASFI